MRLAASLFSAAVFIPVTAFALNYSNSTLMYTDAPFAPAEGAAISVLTNLKAVQGNPDGTFRPERTLNRAEFLKIVLASTPHIRVSTSDAANCFPDVRQSDWFSSYVCLAQKRGVVAGYPDGFFRPENPVNYAEALKMLGEIYDLMRVCTEESSTEGCLRWSDYREQYPTPWYASYAQVASDRGTGLPINLSYAHPLTRGQMARLAAAYRADHDGELGLYRTAERGEYIPVSSSSSSSRISSASSSRTSTGSVSSSSSIASSTSSSWVLPPVSQALVIGGISKPIARGTFTPWEDEGILRIVEVELDREVKSLKSLHIYTNDGQKIGELILDIYDQNDETWKLFLDDTTNHRLPNNTGTKLVLVAQMKTVAEGGFSGERLEVTKFNVSVQNAGDEQSNTLVASSLERPAHTTAMGKITSIRNALAESGILETGTNRRIARFGFSGSLVTDNLMHVEQLLFDIEKTSGLELSNWTIGRPGLVDRQPCFLQGANRVSCSVIPAEMGLFRSGNVELELFANVALPEPSDDRTVQVLLIEPGTADGGGAVWWNDSVSRFTWTESDRPVAKGPLWTVRED
jgi:hypothetical protein